MAWFRIGGGSISAALKNAMNAVLNKKMGTATEHAPETWPDEVNLMGMLQEKTIVFWPICDFEDGSDDVPTKAVKITMPASLTGYNGASVENSGNLCDFDNYNVEANTNTTVPLGADLTLKKGTYTLAFNISDTVTATRNRPCYVVNGNYTYADSDYKTSGRYSWTFTLADDTTLSIRWWAHTVSANITISDFMLTHGSTAHAYEPYEPPTTYSANLGRTVHGAEVDLVSGTGKETHKEYTASDVTAVYWNNHKDQQVDTNHRASFRIALPSGYITQYNSMCDPLSYSTSIGGGQGTDEGYQIIPTAGIYFCIDLADIGMENATSDTPDDDFINAIHNYGDNLKFEVELATPEDFTFDGQEIPTRLGYNCFISEQGDTSVTYRASGTVYNYPAAESEEF